jgi:hypothetical protein
MIDVKGKKRCDAETSSGKCCCKPAHFEILASSGVTLHYCKAHQKNRREPEHFKRAAFAEWQPIKQASKSANPRWSRTTYVPAIYEDKAQPGSPIACLGLGGIVAVQKDTGRWILAQKSTGWGIVADRVQFRTQRAAKVCAEEILPLVDWDEGLEHTQHQIQNTPAGQAVFDVMKKHHAYRQ